MRPALATLAVLVATAVVAAADPKLEVKNNTGGDVWFSHRSVKPTPPGPSTKVPANGTATVALVGDDPFFVQLDLGDAGFLTLGEPLPLKKWAEEGKAFDIRAFFEVVRIDGMNKTVVKGWVGPKDADKKDAALVPLAPDLLALRSSAGATEYKTADGKVAATVALKGAEGTFKTDSFTGTLKDVWYAPNKDEFVIQGRWEAGEKKGVFVWRVGKEDRTKFVGEWRTDDSKELRAWTGKLTPAKAPPK